jgi:hypothetical protein
MGQRGVDERTDGEILRSLISEMRALPALGSTRAAILRWARELEAIVTAGEERAFGAPRSDEELLAELEMPGAREDQALLDQLAGRVKVEKGGGDAEG